MENEIDHVLEQVYEIRTELNGLLSRIQSERQKYAPAATQERAGGGLSDDEKQKIREGKYIEVIKSVRNRLNLGLKLSKMLVDSYKVELLEEKLSPTPFKPNLIDLLERNPAKLAALVAPGQSKKSVTVDELRSVFAALAKALDHEMAEAKKPSKPTDIAPNLFGKFVHYASACSIRLEGDEAPFSKLCVDSGLYDVFVKLGAALRSAAAEKPETTTATLRERVLDYLRRDNYEDLRDEAFQKLLGDFIARGMDVSAYASSCGVSISDLKQFASDGEAYYEMFGFNRLSGPARKWRRWQFIQNMLEFLPAPT